MSWQEGVAVAVVLLGLAAGAFLVAQRPSFWIGFGRRQGQFLKNGRVCKLAEGCHPMRQSFICFVQVFLRAPPFLSHRHLECASRKCQSRSCSHNNPFVPVA